LTAGSGDEAGYIGYRIAWEELPDGGYDFRVASEDARLQENLDRHEGRRVCAFQAATLEAGIERAHEIIDEATPPSI
jgi:hypothetical protein